MYTEKQRKYARKWSRRNKARIDMKKVDRRLQRLLFRMLPLAERMIKR